MQAVDAEAVICGVITAVRLKRWVIKLKRCGDRQKKERKSAGPNNKDKSLGGFKHTIILPHLFHVSLYCD